MIKANRASINHGEQTDRFEPQRYFRLNYGLSPRKMNQLEELGVIKSLPRTNPNGTKYYLVNETWDSIIAYMRKPARTQEYTASTANQKSQNEKFKLRRRKKDA